MKRIEKVCIVLSFWGALLMFNPQPENHWNWIGLPIFVLGSLLFVYIPSKPIDNDDDPGPI